MGSQAPLAVEIPSAVSPELIPWCWGLSGVASVVATAFGMVLALCFGFSALLAGGELSCGGGGSWIFFAGPVFSPTLQRAMKNVAYKLIGDWIVAVYGKDPPTEEEGRQVLATFKSLDLDRVRMLVFTKGGTHPPAQRKALTEALGGKEPASAVVTDVLVVRGVVTALSWFNPKTKCFTPDQLEDAFRFLQIPPSQYDLFRREAMRLEAELSQQPRKK